MGCGSLVLGSGFVYGLWVFRGVIMVSHLLVGKVRVISVAADATAM